VHNTMTVGETNSPAMWFHLESLETVKRGRNDGTKMGDHKKSKSLTLTFADKKALLKSHYNSAHTMFLSELLHFYIKHCELLSYNNWETSTRQHHYYSLHEVYGVLWEAMYCGFRKDE
jgi:hypothetical protein